MTTPRFLQIHTLTSYNSVLLNRDDAGLAKRISQGGVERIRISSQCQKYHWRHADDPKWSLRSIGAPMAVRSRHIFELAMRPVLCERLPTVPADVIDAGGTVLSTLLYGEKSSSVKSRQAMLVGRREIEHLVALVSPVLAAAPDAESAVTQVKALFSGGEEKLTLSEIRRQAGALSDGLESALFGRMVTSDRAANTDAAIHVAHATTVHAATPETDYFVVADDLATADTEQKTGMAGVFDTELSSGLYYGYVVVDVPLLVANLTGVAPSQWNDPSVDRGLAATVVEHLLHLIAKVSPGAKKGSTAPYASAHMVMVEAGNEQPRSLSAAFDQAVQSQRGGGYTEPAEHALFGYLERYDRMYGGESRRVATQSPAAPAGYVSSTLPELAQWAAESVRNGLIADEAK
jgi:CRISPR system Cascade subunit CasC